MASNQALQQLLTQMSAPNSGGTQPSTSVDLPVENVENIQASEVIITLQGRRQTMAMDTFRGLINARSTFRALLGQKFPSTSTTNIRTATITAAGSTQNLQLDSTLPVSLLEATGNITISFATESGTNG